MVTRFGSFARLGIVGAALAASCSIGELPDDVHSSAGGGSAADGGSGGSGGATGYDGSGNGGTGNSDGSAGNDGGDGGIVCDVVYVSPRGNDGDDGCTTATPKKTIGAAVLLAKTLVTVNEIHVCAGTFDEPVTLDTPVDLKGGYDCGTWNRTATYGYPTFDAVHETLVGGSQLPAAVVVTGATIASAVEIDGLTILGAKSKSAQDGVALRIGQAAAPVVSNCRIVGGATFSVTGDGSVGARIEAGAKPEIRFNYIDGGTGVSYVADGAGRAGLVVDSASPFVHHNHITGGAAVPESSDGIASVGLVLRDAPMLNEANSRPILSNQIEGGDGDGGDLISSTGLLALGATDFDLVDSVVRPGDCLGEAVQTYGVCSLATGAVRVLTSRIFGGNLSNPNQPNYGFRVGVWIDGAASFFAENDMVYGGVPVVGFSGGSPSFAISLANVTGAEVRHCTLYSGPSGFPTVGTALRMYGAVTKVVLQNSILAADASWNESLYVEECASAGSFERVENNLFFNYAAIGVSLPILGYGESPASPCGVNEYFSEVDAFTNHLKTTCTGATPGPCASFGGTKVSGNRTLRKTCGADTGCISWPTCDGSSLACLQSVFDGWTASDNGLSTLFGPGWKLAPEVPCSIAKSGLNLGVTNDLLGKPRTIPPSMGAAELDSTTCTP